MTSTFTPRLYFLLGLVNLKFFEKGIITNNPINNRVFPNKQLKIKYCVTLSLYWLHITKWKLIKSFSFQHPAASGDQAFFLLSAHPHTPHFSSHPYPFLYLNSPFYPTNDDIATFLSKTIFKLGWQKREWQNHHPHPLLPGLLLNVNTTHAHAFYALIDNGIAFFHHPRYILFQRFHFSFSFLLLIKNFFFF